jgi:hypothetical protein
LIPDFFFVCFCFVLFCFVFHGQNNGNYNKEEGKKEGRKETNKQYVRHDDIECERDRVWGQDRVGQSRAEWGRAG